jgi:hypothetical protein
MTCARFSIVVFVILGWGAGPLARAVPPARAAEAGEESLTVREWGLRIGGGINRSSQIEYYAVHPYAGLSLWRGADRWFAARGVHARWIIEPWAAFVRDQHGPHRTESFEIGVSPLIARLTFGDATLRPFVEGGEGILYTDLRKQHLGTRVQFSSQIGAGLEYALGPDLALTLGGRFRHISNAGLSKSDPGINTIYGLIGITFR